LDGHIVSFALYLQPIVSKGYKVRSLHPGEIPREWTHIISKCIHSSVQTHIVCDSLMPARLTKSGRFALLS